MSKYEIIIYWRNTDKAYIAEAPELPCCMADVNCYAEVLYNLGTTILAWIETANELKDIIPEPRGKLMFA